MSTRLRVRFLVLLVTCSLHVSCSRRDDGFAQLRNADAWHVIDVGLVNLVMEGSVELALQELVAGVPDILAARLEVNPSGSYAITAASQFDASAPFVGRDALIRFVVKPGLSGPALMGLLRQRNFSMDGTVLLRLPNVAQPSGVITGAPSSE